MFSGWDEYCLINNELARLVRNLPESDLRTVIGYILSAPGKRVRPLILIFSAEAFGGTAGQAMNAALAIELVHAASLAHDDILDCGEERRGQPSVQQRFGPEAALLAGDYLISRSIDLISHYHQPVIRAFAAACMSMAEGEMLDLSRRSAPEDYYQCISRKTASLFAASARIGGVISTAPESDVARLESYGHHLGIAYQVLDDLEEYLGVDQGKSSRKASLTLPRIYGNDSLSPDETAGAMCIKVIEDQSMAAIEALAGFTGAPEMKARLKSIVDEMTLRGLGRCRSQKSRS